MFDCFCKKLKFLSLVYSNRDESACELILNIFDDNKYKTLYFLFNEAAKLLANDEYNKTLRLLEIIDIIDKDNPLKLLKEATVAKRSQKGKLMT